jgi:anti-anti-sigma factor
MTEDAPDRFTVLAPCGSFVVHDNAHAIVVAMNGEFDLSSVESSQRVIEHVGELVAQRRCPVIVDMAELVFLDASGLRFLQRLQRVAQLAETTTRVCNPKPHIEHLLTIVELNPLIDN